MIIINFSKPLTSVTFTLRRIFYCVARTWVVIGCQHDLLLLGWLTNEFAPYVIQAPPLKRCTLQRFTEIDYTYRIIHFDHMTIHKWKQIIIIMIISRRMITILGNHCLQAYMYSKFWAWGFVSSSVSIWCHITRSQYLQCGLVCTYNL